MQEIRILKLHHPTGHPYWDKDEYEIELPDGTFYNKKQHAADWEVGTGCHFVVVKPDGIYYQQCFCSTGGGKKSNELPPVLMVPKSQYDAIVYIGEENRMGEDLISDLKENNLPL